MPSQSPFQTYEQDVRERQAQAIVDGKTVDEAEAFLVISEGQDGKREYVIMTREALEVNGWEPDGRYTAMFAIPKRIGLIQAFDTRLIRADIDTPKKYSIVRRKRRSEEACTYNWTVS